MVRFISRQRGGLAALKLTKLFGIDDFPAAKDSGKVLIITIYCYLIILFCKRLYIRVRRMKIVIKMLNVTKESVTVQERLSATESIVEVILLNDIL